jgi:hypothetical protein
MAYLSLAFHDFQLLPDAFLVFLFTFCHYFSVRTLKVECAHACHDGTGVNGSTARFIQSFGTKLLQPPAPAVSSRYPLNRKPGGSQRPSACFGKTRNFLTLAVMDLQFLRRPARNLATTLTELFRLLLYIYIILFSVF